MLQHRQLDWLDRGRHGEGGGGHGDRGIHVDERADLVAIHGKTEANTAAGDIVVGHADSGQRKVECAAFDALEIEDRSEGTHAGAREGLEERTEGQILDGGLQADFASFDDSSYKRPSSTLHCCFFPHRIVQSLPVHYTFFISPVL